MVWLSVFVTNMVKISYQKLFCCCSPQSAWYYYLYQKEDMQRVEKNLNWIIFLLIQQLNLSSKQMNSADCFQQFINKLNETKELYVKLQKYEDSLALKKYRISQISPNDAQSLLQNITKKFYKYYSIGQSGIWFENQLRLFVWILVCYMETSKKHLRDFTQKDWQFFASILYVKQTSLFEYQARIILDYSLCLRKWSQQQDSLLMKIVMEAKRIKWNQIAKLLFISSERAYTRTSKQCRQRWLNHLDPCKTKLSWSLEEVKRLFEAVFQKGKKWASLVQILKGKRSEHSIKNKYNSILIRQTKLMPELNEKQNCQQIIERITQILSCNKIEEKDELLFGQCAKVIKQNQNQKQQNFLIKSNASLQKTLSVNDFDPQMTIDLDDIVITPCYLNDSMTHGSDATVQTMKKRSRKSKIQQAQKVINQSVDNLFLEDDSCSLMSLNLVIRQSQLDR